jgi:phosphate/phosphite/phosphonate ABC transporter binding protein
VLTPYRATDELIARYRGLADRLGAAAGKPVDIVVARDFGAAADMLVDGRADFGELTPYAFVSGMQRAKLQALAADAMVGRPGTGLIITRNNSRISTLEQLKGKQFGFVDRFSSTGFLGPWANLQSKGFDPATLFTYRFLGSHDAVIKAVLAGDVDAGAVSRHAFDGWAGEHSDAGAPLRILTETSRMPGDVFAASAQLPAATVKALGSALLALSWDAADDKKVLDPINRKAFQPVDVKEYAWLLRVAGSIKGP